MANDEQSAIDLYRLYTGKPFPGEPVAPAPPTAPAPAPAPSPPVTTVPPSPIEQEVEQARQEQAQEVIAEKPEMLDIQPTTGEDIYTVKVQLKSEESGIGKTVRMTASEIGQAGYVIPEAIKRRMELGQIGAVEGLLGRERREKEYKDIDYISEYFKVDTTEAERMLNQFKDNPQSKTYETLDVDEYTILATTAKMPEQVEIWKGATFVQVGVDTTKPQDIRRYEAQRVKDADPFAYDVLKSKGIVEYNQYVKKKYELEKVVTEKVPEKVVTEIPPVAYQELEKYKDDTGKYDIVSYLIDGGDKQKLYDLRIDTSTIEKADQIAKSRVELKNYIYLPPDIVNQGYGVLSDYMKNPDYDSVSYLRDNIDPLTGEVNSDAVKTISLAFNLSMEDAQAQADAVAGINRARAWVEGGGFYIDKALSGGVTYNQLETLGVTKRLTVDVPTIVAYLDTQTAVTGEGLSRGIKLSGTENLALTRALKNHGIPLDMGSAVVTWRNLSNEDKNKVALAFSGDEDKDSVVGSVLASNEMLLSEIRQKIEDWAVKVPVIPEDVTVDYMDKVAEPDYLDEGGTFQERIMLLNAMRNAGYDVPRGTQYPIDVPRGLENYRKLPEEAKQKIAKEWDTRGYLETALTEKIVEPISEKTGQMRDAIDDIQNPTARFFASVGGGLANITEAIAVTIPTTLAITGEKLSYDDKGAVYTLAGIPLGLVQWAMVDVGQRIRNNPVSGVGYLAGEIFAPKLLPKLLGEVRDAVTYAGRGVKGRAVSQAPDVGRMGIAHGMSERVAASRIKELTEAGVLPEDTILSYDPTAQVIKSNTVLGNVAVHGIGGGAKMFTPAWLRQYPNTAFHATPELTVFAKELLENGYYTSKAGRYGVQWFSPQYAELFRASGELGRTGGIAQFYSAKDIRELPKDLFDMTEKPEIPFKEIKAEIERRALSGELPEGIYPVFKWYNKTHPIYELEFVATPGFKWYALKPTWYAPDRGLGTSSMKLPSRISYIEEGTGKAIRAGEPYEMMFVASEKALKEGAKTPTLPELLKVYADDLWFGSLQRLFTPEDVRKLSKNPEELATNTRNLLRSKLEDAKVIDVVETAREWRDYYNQEYAKGNKQLVFTDKEAELMGENIGKDGRIIQPRERYWHEDSGYKGWVRSRVSVIVRDPKTGDVFLVNEATMPESVYSIAGGGLERGFTIEGMANREWFEETGATLKNVKRKPVYYGKGNEHAMPGTYVLEADATSLKFTPKAGEIRNILRVKSGDSVTVTPTTYDILRSIEGFDTSKLKIYDEGWSKSYRKARDIKYADRAKGIIADREMVTRRNLELEAKRASLEAESRVKSFEKEGGIDKYRDELPYRREYGLEDIMGLGKYGLEGETYYKLSPEEIYGVIPTREMEVIPSEEIAREELFPTEPTPVEPTPVEPTPVEPTPVEPTPVEPTPVEPTPVEPTPVEPTPVEPTPVEPTPVEPTPVEPTPVEPEPIEPILTEPTPPKQPPILGKGKMPTEWERTGVPPGTIEWRQGMKWQVLPPPYRDEDMMSLDYPLPGTKKFAVGKGSARKTLQVLGGRPPKDADVDMGWAKIHISSKTGKMDITFGGGQEAVESRWAMEREIMSELERESYAGIPAGLMESSRIPRTRVKPRMSDIQETYPQEELEPLSEEDKLLQAIERGQQRSESSEIRNGNSYEKDDLIFIPSYYRRRTNNVEPVDESGVRLRTKTYLGRRLRSTPIGTGV